MGFRIKPGQDLSSEIRRIVLEQLDIAISELKTVGDPETDLAVHDARRRVKKIRAVIRLVKPVLDKTYRAVDANLSDVSRLLGPVADGQGVLETLDALQRRYRRVLPRRTTSLVRADLVEREQRIDSQAKAEHVLARASASLRAERARLTRSPLKVEGFRAIAPGLKESIRRARDAMLAARRRPTPDRYRTWRRYVKNHWFHVRLIEAQCANQLMRYQRRLEALDGVLGEYHNLMLLSDVLVTDCGVSRREAARCLRIVSNYQRVLCRDAQTLGTRIYAERPRRFVRRVHRLWNSAGGVDNPRSAEV